MPADHYKEAVRHLTALARETEHDLPGVLTRVLAQVAGNLGSSYALIESRPGSWEAAGIQALMASAVGPGDEHLPPPEGSRLTDAMARAIREAALYGETPGPRPGEWRPRTAADVAAEFGVSPGTVRDIAAGRTWKHLNRGEVPF